MTYAPEFEQKEKNMSLSFMGTTAPKPYYDPKFLEWWNKYYYKIANIDHNRFAHWGWIARGHKEFMDGIDKDLKNDTV